MKKKVAVIAIGGNSLIKENEKITIESQYNAVCDTAKHIADLIESNYEVVVTHGNGPQVGFILRRSEIAEETEGIHSIPLVNCGADTQGAIGYQIQQAIDNEFIKRNIKNNDDKLKSAITVVTQTIVNKDDKAFANPSKPIGSFYNENQIDALKKEHPDWKFINDAGRGYRRVVPSPSPIKIVEIDAIKSLISKEFCVIAVGGGGIPVIEDSNGNLEGVDAVIDKDFSTSLLASKINANVFIISTGVPKVCLRFGKPDQKTLEKITLTEIKKYLEEGHFASGSMLPKIKAAIEFLESGGEKVIITSPDLIGKAIIDETIGTTITK